MVPTGNQLKRGFLHRKSRLPRGSSFHSKAPRIAPKARKRPRGGLPAGRALRAVKPLASAAHLAPIGDRKRREIAETRDWRLAYLAEHPYCEVCPIIARSSEENHRWMRAHCRGKAQGIHEIWKRGQGGPLTDPENLLSSCNIGNGWVESHPHEAHELGLMRHPWEKT